VRDAHSATVVCAEVELATGKVCYACAGHLPPRVLHPDGTTTNLWEARSTPLASVPMSGARGEAEYRLEPGSRLLLYTDGLVERRDRGVDEGMAILERRVADLAPLAPEEMVDALMLSMLKDEDVRDDVCLLCFAYDGSG
jgi:serine/threonine-protein kinase RsbW